MLEKILNNTILKDNDCKEWLGCYNTDGYPRIYFRGNANGKVHRIVYELFYGKEIRGKVIRHKCDNPKCINPLHLEEGTAKDNVKDMDERKRRYRKISDETVLKVFSLLNLGFSQKDIAKTLDIDPRRVSDIKNLKLKYHVRIREGGL